MKSNLFERESLIKKSWISKDISDHFRCHYIRQNVILKINLHRASVDEVELFKEYLLINPIKNAKTVIMDFRTCSYIDSSFLSAIINYRKRSNLEIRLVVANKRQLTLFKITRLNSIFNIHLSLDQALV